MLEIQKYLREHGEASYPYFKDTLALMIKEAPDGRVLFKYNQINSPMSESICKEARGIILDKNNNWKIISWPFYKFFNYGEGHAAKIDLASSSILEKVDGTNITLYYWKDKWRTQTLGMMDAEGCVNNSFPPTTFHELFFKTLGVSLDTLAKYLDPNFTYTFELATPYNRIVTRYEKDRIVLLSMRDLGNQEKFDTKNSITHGELSYQKISQEHQNFKHLPVEIVTRYSVAVSSLEDVARLASELPQMAEGYVVVDKDFNRVKVKNPSYLALLHLKDSSSSSVRALVQLVLKNEGSEFLAYFPEFTEQYNCIAESLNDLKTKLKTVYEANKHFEVQKDFALAIQATGVPFLSILFCVRSGRYSSIDEGFTDLDPKRVVETLKMKEIEKAGDW